MREGDVLHVGTHPPGLFLVFHGLIGLCQHSGWLGPVLDATQPASFREACDVIADNARLTGQPLLPTDRRVLWLCTLSVLVAAGLSVVPLYFLIAWSHDPVTAWRTAALWPAIPALAVFVPKADVAYALIGLLITWAWWWAIHRKSLVGGFLTGLLAWCGLMTSLAFLPVVLFTVIVRWTSILRDRSQSAAGTNGTEPPQEARGVEWPHSRRDQLKQAILAHPPLPLVGAGLAGFLIPTIALGWCFRINLFVVWWWNYRNHAGFYAEYPRTYWKWLLENPIELAFAGGWPVTFLAIAALGCSLRTGRLLSHPPAIAVVLVWGSLWLTGKNSSEAARLWIVFLPWLAWLAADRLSQWDREATGRWIRPSTVVLVLQLIVSALTVTRISGFEF